MLVGRFGLSLVSEKYCEIRERGKKESKELSKKGKATWQKIRRNLHFAKKGSLGKKPEQFERFFATA